MLLINGKKFMNLPEAVQWLLDNNALPFQCKANYVADTVIAKSDIINPSPAEIKVGSLVLFADSKVGTVSGVTDSGFMVGQDYTDIGAQLNQIVGIELDASQHLVFTMSNGDTFDVGLIKELSGLSIDASQHLIATYNDGSTTDLGAIFQGNVNITGNFTADSIIENMSGYSAGILGADFTPDYVGVVKNGNKITLACAGVLTTQASHPGTGYSIVQFVIPSAIGAKLFPHWNAVLDTKPVAALTSEYSSVTETNARIIKYSNSDIRFNVLSGNMAVSTSYYIRVEATFLLSHSLA